MELQPSDFRQYQAIETAYAWSASSGNGLALYSLASTRKVHSEDHRLTLLSEIDWALGWNAGLPEDWHDPHGINVPSRDVPLLQELRELVEQAEVGVMWFTFQTYRKWSDRLIGDKRKK